MVNIVTGKINSGKTNKLASMYQFSNEGDGFIAVKIMENGIVTEYRAMRLSTMEERPFIFRDSHVPENFDFCCRIGNFLVSREGLEWIETESLKMVNNRVSPIYLDEIGWLELQDECFHPLFTQLLSSKLELYISVRNELVEKVLTKYHITDYRLM
ncbi:MAG: nucleoside-triphosphatase [Bacteroidales bacterium]|jgi:nucleoside-triphosphatase THEP1